MVGESPQNDDGSDRAHGRWVIGKLLDPSEKEFRDAVVYSQAAPVSDEQIEAILEEFSDTELDEVIAEIKSMAADVPDRVKEMDRREFLKRTVSVAATGSLLFDIASWGETAAEFADDILTRKTPAYYENFWPNSIKRFSELSADETERLLQSSSVSWSTFVNRSTQMLSEAIPGDSVQIHGFYYRAYPRDFFRTLVDVAHTADTMTVYLADPVNGHGNASAVELHQERELLIHEYLLTLPEFKDILARPEKEFAWSAVPHVRHADLNSIRSLLHALRFLETAYYFSTAEDGIRFQPISQHTESPLRGRIILDAADDPKLASFLRFEKGTIGTSRPSKGHLLCDTDTLDLTRETFELHQQFIEDFLQNEHQELVASSPGVYSLSDIEAAHQQVRRRIETLLDRCHDPGPLTETAFADIRDSVDEFAIPSEWQDRTALSFTRWVDHRTARFEAIKTVRGIMVDCIDAAIQDRQHPIQGKYMSNPFESTTLPQSDPHLNPDNNAPNAVYEAALKYQDLL